MAMTKAERTRVDELEREVRLAKALRWPMYTPEVIRCPADGVITGFRAIPSRATAGHTGGCVEHAASRPTTHYAGDPEHVERWVKGDRGVSGSQRGISLYATRRDALMAVRIEVTRDFAGVLASLDKEIEQEP